MKCILIKIYDYKYVSYVSIKFYQLNKLNKYIENEYFKKFSNQEEIEQYINNLIIPKEYLKAKVFIGTLSVKSFVETFQYNDYQKFDIKSKLEELYPNFNNKYQVDTHVITTKNDKILNCYFIPNSRNYHFSILKKNSVYYYSDLEMSQQFISRFDDYLRNKHCFIIQNENNLTRFIEVKNSNIYNYSLIELDLCNNFDSSIGFKLLSNGFDLIIIDSDFKTFLKFSELYSNYPITFIDHIPSIKNIDERKVLYVAK